MENKNPHIPGIYMILAALIGALATLGAIYLKDYLEKKSDDNMKEAKNIESNIQPKNNDETKDILNNDEKKIEVKTTTNIPIKSGSLSDIRDNQKYRWVELKDGKKWMAENLNYNIKGSWCYDDISNSCKEFGRLYTFEQALKACPYGWKLPSKNEWDKMLSHYGGAHEYQKKYDDYFNGKGAFLSLTKTGKNDFSIQFGGIRSTGGHYNFIGNSGWYWTRTVSGSSQGWNYRFTIDSKGLYQELTNIGVGHSCRCIMID